MKVCCREPLKTQNSPHITPVSDTLQQIFCVFFIASRGSLNALLQTAVNNKNDGNDSTSGKITAEAKPFENGKFQIDVTVTIQNIDSKETSETGTIAFTDADEIAPLGSLTRQDRVNRIADEVINTVLYLKNEKIVE
jgi:hypothetical protein